jgi:RHS repeat-associated protein
MSSRSSRLIAAVVVLSSLAVLSTPSIAKLVVPGQAKGADGDRPVGTLGGAVHADPFTGVATTSIPIEVPPGRSGMQPSLALTYNSAAGNSWLGIGWDLDEEGIYRQTKWGVNYSLNTGEQAFEAKMAGVSGELVPTPGSSSQWSPKVEGGFSRLEKLTAGDGQIMWKATTKQGRKYYFGQTTASRQYQVTPLVAGNIFGWLLDRVEDTDGNYMTYSYWTDSSNNQVYLDHIDYAGNGATGPTNQVKFWLDDGSRPDQAELYATNYRVKTAKRLVTVEVKAGGNLVRAYKLTYVTSGTSSSSVVATIQQFGKDATVNQSTGAITPGAGPQQPAVVMGLPAPNNSLAAQSPWGTYVGINSNATLWHTDMNGDGRPDLLYLNTAGTEWHVMLNTGTGLSAAVKWGDYVGMYSTNTIWPVDMNGDGKSDLLYLNTAANEWHVMLNTGTALSSAVKWGNYVGINSNATLWPADMNGDGKSDLLYLNTAGTEWHVMLNTGSALSAAVKWGDYVGINSTLTIWPTDMNGDGKPELLYLNTAGTEWHVMLNTGSALSAATKWGDYVGINSTLSIWATDMNGDGRRDLLYLNTAGTEWHVMLNTGTALRAAVKWGDYVGINSGLTIWPTDMNGDGKPELLYLNTAGTEWHVMLNTGSALSAAVKWGDYVGINSTATIWPADMNGDGRMDLLYLSTPGTQWMVMKNLSTGDLLRSVSTGLGGATTITYDTSSNDGGNRVPFAMQRVKTLSACDSWNSGTSTCTTTPSITTYSYVGGFYHIGARDVRGVNYTKVTSQAAANGDQTISETWFHQGSRVDAVGETEAELLADATAFTKGLPYKSRVTDQTGKAYSESTTTYLADGDGLAPYFTPQAITTTKHFNSAGVEVKQTQTEAVSYDVYGNLTLAYNRGDFTGNNAITSDDTTTALTYAPADTTNWLIGFPTVQRTYAGLGVGGTKLSETLTYYDGASSCTTPAGSATTVTKGHVTKVERWLNGGTNPISGMEYNTYGGVTCTRDPKGNTTTLAYDPTNTFPLTSTNALGHVTTTVYYGVNGVASDTGLYGQAKSVTDPNGKTTTTTYDTLGRKLTTTTPDGLIQTIAYNYGGAYTVSTQHVQSTTSGGGLSANLVSKTYFDGLGRTTKTEQPGAADGGANLKVLVTETQYDIRGLVTQTSLPYIQGSESATGRWRTLTYDALGRLTKTTNPDNTSSTVCYNAWTTTSLDPKLHKKVQTKDALGRLVTVQEYTGTGSATDCSGGTLYATTSYSYDLLGNLLGVTDAKGNVSSMTYDTLGRKLTMHDPDMGDWSYTYDANGNLLTQVDAKNQKLCFSYDALNRRTQKNYGTTTVACGTNTVVYAYDDTVAANNGKGRLKQVSDPAQSVTFQYDSRGRITQTAKTLDGSTYTTTSAYDGLGRMTSVSYPTSPIKTVTYTYDGPQLKSVQEGATTYVTYAGWNALGQPATSTFGNGVVTTHTYANTANATCTQQTFRLCTLKTQKGATPLYQDLQYHYENNGNVDILYDNAVAAHAGDQNFVYDDLDRLTLANGPYGASGVNATLSYAYDEIGNLTLNSQLSASAYVYPASGASSVRPHAVTTAGVNSYTYDANGNMLTGAGRTYTWNQENKPLTVTQSGTTTTFVYDGDGGRVKKIVSTTTTRYISKLYECDNANCSRFIWAGSTRIATIAVNTGTIQYWHGDHLGSSSVITDSTGAKVQTVTYYPFGGTRTNQSPSTPAIDVPYKYTGKELDSTGLYYYEARYYDPTLARFISADTIVPNPKDPQSLNRYSYVENNPLRYTDPTGHFKIKFNKLLRNPIVRGIGWAFAPYTMAFVDKATRPYAIMAAAVVASVYTGGVAATAMSGLVGGGMLGTAAGAVVGGAVGGTVGGVVNSVGGELSGKSMKWGTAIVMGAANGAIGGVVGAIGGLGPNVEFGDMFSLNGLEHVAAKMAGGAAGKVMTAALTGKGHLDHAALYGASSAAISDIVGAGVGEIRTSAIHGIFGNPLPNHPIEFLSGMKQYGDKLLDAYGAEKAVGAMFSTGRWGNAGRFGSASKAVVTGLTTDVAFDAIDGAYRYTLNQSYNANYEAANSNSGIE